MQLGCYTEITGRREVPCPVTGAELWSQVAFSATTEALDVQEAAGVDQGFPPLTLAKAGDRTWSAPQLNMEMPTFRAYEGKSVTPIRTQRTG